MRDLPRMRSEAGNGPIGVILTKKYGVPYNQENCSCIRRVTQKEKSTIEGG